MPLGTSAWGRTCCSSSSARSSHLHLLEAVSLLSPSKSIPEFRALLVHPVMSVWGGFQMPHLPGLPVMLAILRKEGLWVPGRAWAPPPPSPSLTATAPAQWQRHIPRQPLCRSHPSSPRPRSTDGICGSMMQAHREIQVHHHVSVFGFGLRFY